MYSALRPLLFSLDAETAHHAGIRALGVLGASTALAKAARALTRCDDAASLHTTVAGMSFSNPIGLAAGLDKNAEALPGLFSLGFGFVEIGTVTPRPQPGNPRPRVFRIPEHRALINRMGFNNDGVEAVAERLRASTWRPARVGVNIGKNKTTPNEDAVSDYVLAARALWPLGDYVAVNLSSPNTPGLRELQEPAALERILKAVRAEIGRKPLFFKLAPDLADEGIDAAVDVAKSCGVDGLICANTTITRPVDSPVCAEIGGFSGAPLRARATEVVRRAFRRSDGALAIIGVGGVFDGADAWEKICAGASLVQLYTGFIYGGPGLPARVVRELSGLARQAGVASISNAVGRDA